MNTPRWSRHASWSWFAVLMVAGALPGCAGSSAAPAPAAPKPAAPAAAQAAPAAPIAAAPAAPATAAPQAAAPPPPEPARIAVGGLGGLIDRVLYVAQDKGYFREQGIELDYTGVTSMVQAAPFLASGQMEV